jgi:5'-nucleotidase
LKHLLACDWEPGSFVNVNFPDCPPDAVTGTHVTTQGRRLPGSFRPVRRVDERNFPYYWIKLAYEVGNLEEGTDLFAIAENAVSVTPMQLDLTSNAFRHYLDRTIKGAEWSSTRSG